MRKFIVFATIVILGMFATDGYAAHIPQQSKNPPQASTHLIMNKSDPYQTYFNYIGSHPTESETAAYREESQGLTHDDQYWYITNMWTIFKFHYTQNLNDEQPIARKALSSESDLNGYNHFGDLSYYKYGDQGYLVIPVEGDDIDSILAVFQSNDLSYVGKAPLNSHQDDKNASACAVDPNGNVYIAERSNTLINSLRKYHLRWDLLTPYNNNVVLEPMSDFTLWDETGENALYVRDVQGIVISDDGQFMYMSCGDDEHSQDERPEYGIHAFEVQNLQAGRRIRQSSMSEMPFKFDWDYGHESEEPEGITIWDLDGMDAPYISGQLHIMLLDNDEWQLNTDDVYLRHYTNVIYVDYRANGNRGWASNPFHTVGEANTYAWDGSRISIHAGTYAEALIIDKKVQLLATGGTVVIGAGARSSLSTSDTTNISDDVVESFP